MVCSVIICGLTFLNLLIYGIFSEACDLMLIHL